jgi:predicted NBD/HSP70 family sugar kinase
MTAAGSPARPHVMRAMNEQLLLDHIRAADGISRADLARVSGLAKNTVSLALANLERASLVRVAGVRTGVPGPAAVLYEVRSDCGFVLGLDVGRQYLRGAVADINGELRASATRRTHATTGLARVADLVGLAGSLLDESDLSMEEITQTVIGSPGVYDPRRSQISLAGGLPGWETPAVLAELRNAFGPNLVIENDIDAAALAERAHGHGSDADSFVFISVGTGIGMGVVLDGRLHRGHHGVAGEIGYMPLDVSASSARGERGERDARRRGSLEASASAAGVVRAGRILGGHKATSAQHVFAAAARGEEWAERVVADEALLIARAVCSVITVIDPQLVVLGGGIGQADGFRDAVAAQLGHLSPVVPELRVSALGANAVVDGCIAAGLERAWQRITAPPAA